MVVFFYHGFNHEPYQTASTAAISVLAVLVVGHGLAAAFFFVSWRRASAPATEQDFITTVVDEEGRSGDRV